MFSEWWRKIRIESLVFLVLYPKNTVLLLVIFLIIHKHILTAGELAPSTSTPEEFSNVLTTFSLPENAAKCNAVKLDSVASDLSMA